MLPHSLSLVGRPVSALGSGIVVPLAWTPTGFDHITLAISARDMPLSPTVAGLAVAHRRRLMHTPGGFNELRFTPSRIVQRDVGARHECRMDGQLTDYAAWEAAKQEWERVSGVERLARCRQGLDAVGPHGVGVATAVLCRDGCIVLARRSGVANWYPGHWATVAEGAEIYDIGVGLDGVPVWDPLVTARRGLREELAVASTEIVWRLHSVVVDVGTGSVSVLARAKVPYSSDEVLAAWRDADDADEASTMAPVAWSLEGMDEVIARCTPMVPVDALTVVGALALDTGWELCRSRGWLSVQD